MREYALIILDVSDAVRSIRSLYKLLCSYQDRSIQNIVKYLRERGKKGGGEVVLLIEHFNKHFLQKTS